MSEYLNQQLLGWGAHRTALEREGAKALRDADNHVFPWAVLGMLLAVAVGLWALNVGDGYVLGMLCAVIVSVAHFLFVDRWMKDRIKSDYALRLKEADAQIAAHIRRIENLRERDFKE